MRFRRVAVLTVVACLAGIIAVSLGRAGREPMYVHFTRYGSYPTNANLGGRELANKTAAFFLISNPGPQTVAFCEELFAWSGRPYVSTQVRLAGWTDAQPVPAQVVLFRKLAPGKSCEVAVALGTGLPHEWGGSRYVAATNLVWRLGIHYRSIGFLEQVGLDELLIRLCERRSPSGHLHYWPEWLMRMENQRLRQHRHTVWSDPVVPP